MPEHNLIRMPLIITIILAVVGLNILYFTPEEQTIVAQIPTAETLVIEPTPSPTPTSKPQVANQQPEATPRPTNKPRVEPKPTIDPDPIVNCHGAKGGQCENQVIKLRRSECNGSSSFVCCQVDNSWKLMSRSECAKAQNNKARDTNSASNSKPQNIGTNKAPVPAPTPDPAFEAFLRSWEADLERQDLALDKLSEEIANRAGSLNYTPPQSRMLYDMCVDIVNSKYGNLEKGYIAGAPVKQDVFYGTESNEMRKYQDELSGCNSLLK